MSKRHPVTACVAAALLLSFAGVSAAEDYGDTVVRRLAYEHAARDRVASIPATQTLVDTVALGRRKIAFFTADGARPKVWLLTTDAGCGEPTLVGSQIVSTSPGGATTSCSVERIQPVSLLTLKLGLGVIHATNAYGADNLWSSPGRGSYQIAATMGGRR